MSDERTGIDAAIDAAEAGQVAEEMARLEQRRVLPVPVLVMAHTWSTDNEVAVLAVPGDLPTMLIWDGEQGAFRAIVLPDGTSWRIVPDVAGLWRPDQP